jgi:hypothetical protein
LEGTRPGGDGDAREGKAENDSVSSSPLITTAERGLAGGGSYKEGKGSGAPSRSSLF